MQYTLGSSDLKDYTSLNAFQDIAISKEILDQGLPGKGCPMKGCPVYLYFGALRSGRCTNTVVTSQIGSTAKLYITSDVTDRMYNYNIGTSQIGCTTTVLTSQIGCTINSLYIIS